MRNPLKELGIVEATQVTFKLGRSEVVDLRRANNTRVNVRHEVSKDGCALIVIQRIADVTKSLGVRLAQRG